MTRCLLPIVILWAMSGVVNAGIYHDPDLSWYTIVTPHFRIHYHNGEAAIAQRFWPIAERIYHQNSSFLDWYPRGKTDVVLTDEFDLSNGYTRVFPYKSIVLFVAAPDEVNSLEDYDNWLALVFRHEFMHIVHLDMVRGVPRGFQRVFGRNPLLFPNSFQPRWVIEGLAVYAETNKKKGVGRGQSAYFNMMMRMESLAGLKPVRRVNQPISSWPAGDVPYLYGVFFFEFIHDKYGDKDMKEMIDDYSHDLVPFRINSNAIRVFHKSLPELWNEYAAWLKQKFAPVVARVKREGLRVGKNLTHKGYQAGPLQSLGKRIYFYQFTGDTHARIEVIKDNGKPSKLINVNQGARFTVRKGNGLLITQPEICRNARLYFDIYRVDANGDDFQRLTHCARYRNAVWTQHGKHILAVHDALGNNRLDLLDDKGHKVKTLWQGKNGVQIGQMAGSEHQPFIVATVWRPKDRWNLEKFNLQTRQWTFLTHDKRIETQPQFTPDGQSILYSADYGGIYNLYRYNLQTKNITKLSNVMGGAFYPALAGNRLAYIGYSARGFDVYSLPASSATKPPMPVSVSLAAAKSTNAKATPSRSAPVSTAGTAAAAKQQDQASAKPVKEKILPSRPYSPWRSLVPTWWFPYFLVDSQRVQLGAQTSGSDVLQRHQYGAALAYDFKNKLLVGNLDYVYDGLWPVFDISLSRDTDLYLDNNKQPMRVRANDQAAIQMIVPFLSLDDDWFVQSALIKQADHDVWTNGVPYFPKTNNDIAGIALRYVSAKTYPLSISRSEGSDMRLIYEDSALYGNSQDKGQITVADLREFIHLGGEQVLALRLVEGRGRNNPSPFRLGGIQGDTSVLSTLLNGQAEQLFNKRAYSLRGYREGYSQLSGKNMRLISMEYRFPIDRIEYGWMVPPIGFNQVSATVFYDVGGVWDTGTGPSHYYRGVGFEINADLDVFYNTRLNTSLGFARGLDKQLGENEVYLRIGSEF